jgi:hypothetical protein
MRICLYSVVLAALLGSTSFTHSAFATTIGPGAAYPLTFEWQTSADPNIAGYALYYGTSSSTVTNRLDVGPTNEATLTNLTASVPYYFFVVSYYAGPVESDPSNIIYGTPSAVSSVQLTPSSNDGGLTMSFYVAPNGSCHVEYTDSLNPPVWTALTSATGDAMGRVTLSVSPTTGGTRFYRVVVP